jgi:hypothetical protein
VIKSSLLSHFVPVVVFAFYSCTAWAISTQKIFDARDIFRTGLRFGLSIGVVSAIMWGTKNVRTTLVPHPALTIIGATLITIFFNRFNLRVLRATLMGGDREADGGPHVGPCRRTGRVRPRGPHEAVQPDPRGLGKDGARPLS